MLGFLLTVEDELVYCRAAIGNTRDEILILQSVKWNNVSYLHKHFKEKIYVSFPELVNKTIERARGQERDI